MSLEQRKQEIWEAISNNNQLKVNEIVAEEMQNEVAPKIQEIEEDVAENLLSEESKYDKVFRAVAKHLGMDSEDIDKADSDAKKEFYDMVDKCWDEDEDKIPDACPVDISESITNESAKELKEATKFSDFPPVVSSEVTDRGVELKLDVKNHKGRFSRAEADKLKKKIVKNLGFSSDRDVEVSNRNIFVRYEDDIEKVKNALPKSMPVNESENVNEISDYNATSLHGSGGTVNGSNKSKQKSAKDAAYKMMNMQATNFNDMMNQVYSTKPSKARAFQAMITQNPGEQSMKDIANEMMDDSDLAKIMKQYLQ